MSFTLLQNVEVLSVAQESQKPVARLDKDGKPIAASSASDLATRPDNTDASPKARTVTLGVLSDDAAKLALAGKAYSIYLSLRGPGDDSTIDAGTSLQQLPPTLR